MDNARMSTQEYYVRLAEIAKELTLAGSNNSHRNADKITQDFNHVLQGVVAAVEEAQGSKDSE